MLNNSLKSVNNSSSESHTKSIFSISSFSISAGFNFSLSNVFGLLINKDPSFLSINVKSDIADITAHPPPHIPKTALICTIFPDACPCFAKIFPNASNASDASCNLIPAQSIIPMTGAPVFIARS